MTEPPHPALPSDLSGPVLLRLARKDRSAARDKLRRLDAEAQANACQELRPEVRSEFLMLLDHPEHANHECRKNQHEPARQKPPPRSCYQFVLHFRQPMFYIDRFTHTF